MSETGLQTLTFHIRGLTPLLLHNGQLTDQLNPASIALSKAVKAATKGKTESLIAEVARMEFLGSFYVDDEGAPCAPGENLEAAIRSAAKHSREGKAVQTGLMIEGNVPIIYKGPKTPQELWDVRSPGEHEGPVAGRPFVDRRRCKLKQNAVMRTRPIFREWEMVIPVLYDTRLINKSSLMDYMKICSEQIGLFEMRPKFGRFEILKVS